ncbi:MULTISPECIES: 5-formyltetrahydrofolate cyclo-ligase [Aerococcus]|uniref:5-formyltetrahydrofolate cyclo-ligase n=2 Tax=Aerococcus TaxID=1375 RepID=A0A5N1GTA2_9LACT|nr:MULTISPECIES: 5-formyltetrahydrofolate cyclo-ligase [Aerococcus]KAA9301870.1 5-formyltetrahydrofolate cyclo-ligase [Aerococcus sanguinicola]MDK6368708.1 5-formyltetrahydrofolate cyclo-ligase [Aerococcus sp. UMB9870]MDK6685902.1 5-formyltetrahydrofolate cyclo-ligase [Aerococcus sp. UMB8623]MDK6939331.1 5-formyltetrahydrofolate cyclo-ligase [Aerococcus sp. UMB8487]OFK19187.1 hypothetical protein HMPREF2829_01250 [Aerococcus sp. HMSC072A12]
MLSKKELRQRIKAKRQELSPDYYQSASQSITERLLKTEAYHDAQCIFTFLTMPREFDTEGLIRQAWQDGKTIVVPRVERMGEMSLRRYDQGDALILSSLNIEEPSPEAEIVPIEAIDWVTLPCMTCNPKGERLGYGGGFYDRFLAQYQGKVTLPYFEKLMVDEIPMAPHDHLVPHIVTEAAEYFPGR